MAFSAVPLANQTAKLDQLLAEPFNLVAVSYESDIAFSAQEFAYLTGLKAGMMVDAKILKLACFYLEQRKIFAKIRIVVKQDCIGKSLHFILTAQRRLGRVAIEGILFGKDNYRRIYESENVEYFSPKQHQLAVKKIIVDCKNNGYLNTQVQTVFTSDHARKLMNLSLKIERGKRFKFKNFQVDFMIDQPDDNPELDFLKKSLIKELKSQLLNEYYTSKSLHQTLIAIKKQLLMAGYPFAQINFNLFKDQKRHSVALKLNIFLKQMQKYQFFGNQFYTSQALIDHIMNANDAIWHLPVDLVVQDLIRFYHEHGFFQVAITGSENKNIYQFNINEGSRAKITKIKYKGSNSFSANFLTKYFFKAKVIGKYYHKQNLNQVLNQLNNWFTDQGYWDFKILKTDLVCLDESNQNHELIIVLEQGLKYLLKHSTILDYPDLKLPYCQPTKNLIFKTSYLQLQKKWLLAYFSQKKQKNITCYPKIKSLKSDDLNQEVAVEWQINELEPMIIGKTIRRGNADMKFNKLYQNLPYQAGDYWSKQSLTATFFRIKNLDVFDSVLVYPNNELDPAGHKPVILDLNLDHNLELRTRFGFQQVSKNFAFKAGSTYKVGSSLIYKNLTNAADQLRFDFDLTRYYRSVVAQYLRPIHLHLPLYFTAKIYTNKYEQPIFLGSKYRLYNVSQQGTLLDLSYKDRYINIGFNSGIEAIEISDISKSYAQAIDFSDRLLCKQVPFWFLESTFLADYLDDKLNPRNGMLTLLTSKTMVALGDTQSYFLKFLLDQSFFIPILQESVLAICLRAGHIFTNDFRVIMPIERFYLGGTYSIRSYEPDFAPPLGRAVIKQNIKEPGIPEQDHILYLPQGGKSMINLNFELRFPIYQNLGGVVFQDLGTLLKSGENLGQNALLTGTGFGLRYKTPIGPLRFDIGWRPGNFAWFLTIGHAF